MLTSLMFCLCLNLSAPQPDRWVGEDKFKHLVTSFVATSISASAARAAGLDARASVWAGVGFGAGVGVWKELRDRARPEGTASLKDLAWDAAGIGAAALVMREVR